MDGTSVPEILGSDVFFEIIDPIELGYTYRLRPAKDFGAPFVSSLFSGIFECHYSSSTSVNI